MRILLDTHVIIRLAHAPGKVAEQAALDLPLALDHFRHLAELPMRHQDPFDRLLYAQARSEALCFAAADNAFDAYADAGVSLLRC